MALYYNLKTNFSDNMITHFQKEICDAIKNNTPLKDSDLGIIKVSFYDKEEFLFDSNYLFFKDFIDKHSLFFEYHIRNDNDEKKIEIIKNRTGGLLASQLKNYKYLTDISKSISLYKTKNTCSR
ncbi:hypothetical protein [Tenacibaculum maritimum]|uniref:Uncharacterized protein n=2 Tax=Tenacibaculum maritimum TaxID=107401 RepID=A0A2H1ECG5_9FLAO|nr:hypothetical protein [Tenacibaculum maritimum]MCD9584880.1 hypothetical protein [Tenacibaculum maritimum]MCD9620614.1 hypothetical protein [Tenacibaculum maritimum]MCD9626009.1 hypothetical protein [Tenacibaculum maritimum]MCD9631451.1 hypothetical protein [Tenacibaculum maritimum]MCD9634456.1 hypothetical protein [Tenacibaculum maritimum]